MKFVGLVSGGKDSLFNILHCIKNGHELVALANLYPPESVESDEMDSFMYQTVGYHALAMYGECLGVPLYRGVIRGTSKATGLEYEETDTDETEDLYDLLTQVTTAHPDIKAVSVGAILSTYQRTRVEDVCNRLGLTSLAFLWRRRQDELLDEIIASGVDARIIKTAAIGLGRQHLGKSLGEVRGDLVKFNEMYGIHLCGEGGEYETLVVDAPIFQKRLKLDMEKSEIKDFSHEFVTFLNKIKVDLEDKEEGTPTQEFTIHIPDILNERSREVLEDVGTSSIPELPGVVNNSDNCDSGKFGVYDSGQETVCVDNIRASRKAESIESEVKEIFQILETNLEDFYGLDINSVSSVILLLKSMDEFEKVNSVYKTYFTKSLPPARLCLQTGINSASRVQLSATASYAFRTGMHVQGRSYWAPSNIGAYSQIIFNHCLFYLSGQIGLIPSSMTLHPDIKTQAILGLQHLVNVADAQCCRINAVMCFITSEKLLELIRQIWKSATQPLDPIDTLVKARQNLIICAVDGLPKNASIEWAAFGEKYEQDEDESEYEVVVTVNENDIQSTRNNETVVFTSLPQRNQQFSGKNVPVRNLYSLTEEKSMLAVVVRQKI